MNSRQKKTLVIVAVIVSISFIVWLGFGREIFTKTQVLVEKRDELFPDMVQKEWVNKFIWGLDLTGAISFISIVIGAVFYFRFRDKKMRH
jgi:preprotein translocase subunit SecD